ncbi:uncharacterized protein [Epargyreus clarus]|uniref:uncharacterized protein isoform X1 n=1 Tax=Epargyreus clarus TaxID=520877 RepID=UPI003C2DB064
MQKHAAYTEWADAYSCTRHRCQPGGRNLAIYTVGCKRVEAPESAIECEEVVEDTNMQFPFCCTRLRCLVVVRGEVWTRVLGQPWETLPAAPWSHMYKMKKPPPPNGTLLSKTMGAVGSQGPIYELSADSNAGSQKVLRATKKTTDGPDCENTQKSVPIPDIIALATESDSKDHKKIELRHKLRKASVALNSITDDEASDREQHNEVEFEDAVIVTEKVAEGSDEKINSNAVTRKNSIKAHHQGAWTEIPQKEWNEQDPATDNEGLKEAGQQSEISDDEKGKPALQALVDAIGTRMRDIENVVQKMSEKVHQVKPGDADGSFEKRVLSDAEILPTHSHHKSDVNDHLNAKEEVIKPKQPGPDADHYKRFTERNKGSKYLHSTVDVTSEPPLFVEDAHLNGYFSDASNTVLRRANPPKEPAQTYMAPVETRRKSHILSDASDETKKHKKHSHKKRKGHKKHHGKDKRKRFNRLSSAEVDKNVVSLEDSSAVVNN